MLSRRYLLAIATAPAAFLTLCLTADAQVVGPNVNMVSGTQWPGGDPYLQRQNEPSMAVSTRNPLHLLSGANDYRTVDIPFPPDSGTENGDAWLGVFQSLNSGQSWTSMLLPGYPQDQSAAGLASPLRAFAVATDPTVRAGTHGLFYYSGLAFNRGNNTPSANFVAVFQDLNNKGNGNPVQYINTTLVDSGNTGQFLDKPWLAVDIPRPGTTVGAATCTINGQTFTSGNVYLAYSTFLGTQPQNNPHTQIMFAKSTNCGASWSKPTKLSESFAVNQGTIIAVDPGTGALYIAWRQISNGTQPDSLVYVSSLDGGQTFTKGVAAYTFPAGMAFDQSDSATAFRTIALPALAVDGTGRAFLAWSQRNLGPLGSARIMASTLPRGSNSWTTPFVADVTATSPGHQFLPSFTFAFGKLMLIFYDLRNTNTVGQLKCAGGACNGVADFTEVRVPVGDRASGNLSPVFNSVVSDAGLKVRQTLEVWGAMVDSSQFNAAANPPLPFNAVRISNFKFGSRPGSNVIEQLQFNPPNFPMFAHGTIPFIGDYIEVAALQMVLNNNTWTFNTAPSNAAVFHATWTDNRDVRPPPVTCSNGVCAQNWTLYTPVGSTGGVSLYDPTQTKPACIVGQTGSRNQNIYTARITQGLFVGLRENSKQLLTPANTPLQRTFSVLVQNNTTATAYYRLTIVTPLPAGTTASFVQTGSAVLTLDVGLPRKSSAARSVFVNATAAKPAVTVSVVQITAPNGAVLAGGLQSTAVINPDITNPDITNPDITNPDITNPDITNPDITNPDITSAEVYNPTVTNPDITNPDIASAQITNPDITNPDITNPDITNPDITSMVVVNPDITNPDITNPDITNPDITNPDITNPDIAGVPAGGMTDYTWKLTNKGNTTASYNAKLFLKQSQCCPAGCPGGANCPVSCNKCQLVLRRTYPTPIANGCTLAVETQNSPIASVPNPSFANASNAGTPDTSSDPTNATVSLGPGEGGRVTLRVFGVTVPPTSPAPVKPIGVSSGANTGQSAPATSLTLTTTELPTAVVGAAYSATLQSVGGTGASRLWTLLTGVLPSNLNLNSASGQITGPVTASTGAHGFIAQVQDSPPAPTAPHLDNTALTLQVSQLSITSVTAVNSTTGTTWLRAGQSATVTVTIQNLGNVTATSVNASALSVSSTGPTITCGPASPAGATILGGAHQAFTYACGLVGSGPDGSITFGGQASGLYVNSAAAVAAGTGVVTSNAIVVDTTPPVMTVSATTGGNPYAAGTWTNKDVTVTFSCTDSLSGVALGSPTNNSTVFSVETSNGSVTSTCMDNAGNSATLGFSPVMLDKTPPVVTFGAANPVAIAAGWNNTNVSFSFTVTDTLSGPSPSNPAGPVVVSMEGAGVTGSVTVRDVAGNVTISATPAVNIDKTPPTVSFRAPSPAPNAAGWNNTNVSIPFTLADNASGVASSSTPSPLLLTSEGMGITGAVTATDIAGNSKTYTSPAVKIDKTPPTVVIASPLNGSTYRLNSSITASYTCADGLSGITGCAGTQANGATFAATPVGSKTFVVSATDAAGNTTGVTNMYTVAYTLLGFFTPLATVGSPAAPTDSGTFNLGKAIPVKWQLTDANGSPQVDLATLVNLQAISNPLCKGAPPPGATSILLYNPTSGATGGSTFRIDASGSQYIFNWDTSSVPATGCYNLVAQLNDTKAYATIVHLQ